MTGIADTELVPTTFIYFWLRYMHKMMIIVIRRNIDKISGSPDIVLVKMYYMYYRGTQIGFILKIFILSVNDFRLVHKLSITAHRGVYRNLYCIRPFFDVLRKGGILYRLLRCLIGYKDIICA